METAWLEYGAHGLLAMFFILIAYKILPDHRKAQEKRDTDFADALKKVEELHSEDTERVINAHQTTISMLVAESDKRHQILTKVADNQQETSRLIAANSEVLRQLSRDPKARTRLSDSQRRAITQSDKEMLDEARRIIEEQK